MEMKTAKKRETFQCYFRDLLSVATQMPIKYLLTLLCLCLAKKEFFCVLSTLFIHPYRNYTCIKNTTIQLLLAKVLVKDAERDLRLFVKKLKLRNNFM
jgi:hypothetical protein